MKAWQNIVNKATLGSGKLPLKAADLPEHITAAFHLAESADAEEDFLRLTAFAYQYRQAGATPLNLATIAPVEATEETNPYCHRNATRALKAILAEEHQPFLELWLTQCATRNYCVHPELIPDLFEAVARKNTLHALAAAVGGKRGEWLATYNPQWRFTTSDADNDNITLWENGTPEERKKLLRHLRQSDPAAARELLVSTWSAEGANEKVAFLEILKTNASANDLPWLESLSEKGVKVNTAILEIRKLIPQSTLAQSYGDVIKSAIQIKTGKKLFINEAAVIPEAIFKTGIEKLSSIKNVSDLQNALAQLIAVVHPAFWITYTQETTEAIIAMFLAEKETTFYIPAIAFAAIRYRDTTWIKALLDHAVNELPDPTVGELIGALDADKDAYALKLIAGRQSHIIPCMLQYDREWSLELATAIVKYTAAEVYTYNKTFYRQACTFIPASLAGQLDQFMPSEELKKTYWKTQSDELFRLLTLKQQTLQYFTA